MTIPSHLAYGDRGVGPIPAKATLGMFYFTPNFIYLIFNIRVLTEFSFVAELVDIAGSSKHDEL